MSTREFLERMRKVGQQATGGGAGIVSKVRIQFGVHRFVQGHPFWAFWKPVADENDIERVVNEVAGRIQAVGGTEKPNFGLKVTIDKDVLNRDQPYKDDLQEFIASWQEDAFNLIFDHVEEAGLPLGEWFWGHVQYKADPFFVAKGDAGKTEEDQNGNPRFPTIRVPVKKFKDKEEAQAFVGSSAVAAVDSGGYSAKALEGYGTAEKIEAVAEEVLHWLDQADKGISFNNDADSYPLPTPTTPPKIKMYIAEIYGLEPSDIDMMQPF